MGKRKSKRQKPKPQSKVRRTNPPGDANQPDDEPIPLNIIEPTLLLEAPSVQEATCREGTRVEDATIGEGRRDEDAAIGEETRVGEEETQVDDGGAYVSDREREAISEDDCEVQSDTDLDIEEENCDDIRQHFGVDEKDDEDASDVDSGDDINWDDEKIPEPLSCSEDEEEVRDEDAGDVDPLDPEEILKLWKCFNTTEEFKLAVLRYSLKTRYDVKLYRSEQSKIGAKCTDTDSHCPWKCYASYERRMHKMQIKIYVNVHTCVRSGYSKMLKQGTIAWLFQERLRMNLKLTKQEMAVEVQREYNLVVSEEKCAKAKTQVAKERKQSHEDHFARVWDYQAEIFQSNPDSTFEIETIPGPSIGSKQRFFRLYICFKAQREAWKQTCRPIIGIDGAFLRWDIKGHLLAAVGRDGDNRIVPLAWAVVEIENDINWDWFVRLLSVNLSLEDGSNVAIISDKQKGLVKAVHNILPQAEHRQCARHIMDNWKRDSHDMELQRLFWKIARSYIQGEFGANMEALKRYNPHSFATLQLTNPATWSRAFFRIGSSCNDILNNLSESFNRTIRQARKKPLLEMLEDIRRQCMVRNEKRFVIAGRLKTRFSKRAHAKIEKMIKGSQFCETYIARNNLHEVEHAGVKYRVDMNALTCGCRKWQMIGIPCIHAAKVIIGKKQKVEDYVVHWYTTEMWRMTYQDGIMPVQGELLWPRLNRLGVLPPPWRKGNRGRPCNHARRKGRYETTSSQTRLSRQNRVMTCSNCREEGHNKSSCKNQRVESQPPRRPGRPRKEQGQSSSQAQASQGQNFSQRQASQAHDSQAHGWPSWFQ